MINYPTNAIHQLENAIIRSEWVWVLGPLAKDKPSSTAGSPSGNSAATSTAVRPLTRSRRDARPMSGLDGSTETVAPRRSLLAP